MKPVAIDTDAFLAACGRLISPTICDDTGGHNAGAMWWRRHFQTPGVTWYLTFTHRIGSSAVVDDFGDLVPVSMLP